MHQDDKHLLEQVRDGNAAAFRLLFEKYQPILFRYAMASFRDSDTAHDVVQETFLRVWNHRSALQADLPFMAYLFRISRNLMRDRLKHLQVRSRWEASVRLMPPAAPDDPESISHSNLLREQLAVVIRKKLPARCREIFLLSRMEGMSHAEISAALHISMKTVENQITRAQKILRKHTRKFLQT